MDDKEPFACPVCDTPLLSVERRIAQLEDALEEVLDGVLEEQHWATPRHPRQWYSVGAWLVDGEGIATVPLRHIRALLDGRDRNGHD